MVEFQVYIITNSLSDLTKLDFPGFKILNIKSEEFNRLLINSASEVSEFSFNKITQDRFKFDGRERYVILQKDLNQPCPQSKLDKVFNFLILLFPSSLVQEHHVFFKSENNKLIYETNFEIDIVYYYLDDERQLVFNEDKVVLINHFIKKCFKTYTDIGYLKSAVQNYLYSFNDRQHHHFSFIALCIALESITNGNSELLYRIRRNLAVICGKDPKTSQIIFDNINTIYKLRSKIVHGSDYSDERVSELLYYLKLIVSKTIIELLIHNITNLELLNKKITSLGFGDRDKISENWIDTIFNNTIENTIYQKII